MLVYMEQENRMELIDRDAVIALIEAKQKELCPLGRWSRHAVYGTDRDRFDEWDEIIDELDAITAIDAVPVVRCFECQHCEMGEDGVDRWCVCRTRRSRWGDSLLDVDPMDYCSDGERRADNETD